MKQTKKQTFELGISTKGFNEFQLEELLGLLSNSSISQIELSGNCFSIWENDERFEKLQRALLTSGVKLNSIHVPFHVERSDYANISEPEYLDISHPDRKARKRVVKMALLCLERLIELGGRCLVVHPSHEPIRESERVQRLEYSLESLQVLKEHLPVDGSIDIAVENMCRTSLGRESSELLSLLERVDSPHFGICLDVNHCFQEEVNGLTKSYASFISSIHISDNDGVNEQHWMPGKGVINWSEWIKTILEIEYKGPLIYEIHPEWNWPNNTLSNEEIVDMIIRNAQDIFVEVIDG